MGNSGILQEDPRDHDVDLFCTSSATDPAVPIRVCLCGDSFTGKTTLAEILRDRDGYFAGLPYDWWPYTIEPFTRRFRVDGELYDLTFNETKSGLGSGPDPDRYNLRLRDNYPHSDVFLLFLPHFVVHGVGCHPYYENESSVFRALELWVAELREVRPDVPIVLVGSKSDLVVDPDEAEVDKVVEKAREGEDEQKELVRIQIEPNSRSVAKFVRKLRIKGGFVSCSATRGDNLELLIARTVLSVVLSLK